MGALAWVFRTEVRRRWRSWLALSVLIAVVGGLAMGAAAAGRRTASAYPQYVTKYGFDAVIYSTRPLTGLGKLPVVRAVGALEGPDTGQPTCACTQPINPSDFGVAAKVSAGWPVSKLVSGRAPNPSSLHEAVASFTLKQLGVHIGSVIRVPLYAASQAAAYDAATGALPAPKGPVVWFKVVGFEASEFEFPNGSSPSYNLYASAAFDREIFPKTAGGTAYLLRLRDGAADLPRLQAEVRAIVPAADAGIESEDGVATAVEESIHPQSLGWWLLSLLATLVGLAVLAQALFRQSVTEAEDYPTLSAIGVEDRQLLRLAILRNLFLGLAGALGAVLVATALSPLAPLGEARDAEISPGLHFDTFVFALGALAVVFVVLALGAWPAMRAVRVTHIGEKPSTARPSLVAAKLASLGAPPVTVIGVRHALERRHGVASVPVSSTILGMVLGIVALAGTAVFGSSLSHLTSTPRLYGADFALNFSDLSNGSAGPQGALLKHLLGDPEVTALTEGIALGDVDVNGRPVGAIAAGVIKGRPAFSVVTGKYPVGDGQVALGAATLRQLGAHLGSLVRVDVPSPSGGRHVVPFRVVSQLSFPVLAGDVGLGDGALFTFTGFEDAVCPPTPDRARCEQAVVGQTVDGGGVLVSVAPGPKGLADVSRYLRAYGAVAALPVTPTSLVNFGQAVNFPLIFGAVLALFGAATLVHLLVVSVSRRRREIGLLKVLGFVNKQVGAAVAWQATTLCLIGLAVGIPVGIALGRAVWLGFANDLGAVPVAVVPLWLIAVLAAGVAVVANLLAVGPALVAAQSKAGELLRARDANTSRR